MQEANRGCIIMPAYGESVLRVQITVATWMHEGRQRAIMDDTIGVIDFVRYPQMRQAFRLLAA